MSCTRTFSFRRACSQRSPVARRSSSPPTGRTSRTRAGAARSGRRRGSPCGAPQAVVAVSAWLLDRLVEVVPAGLAEEPRDRLRRRPRALRPAGRLGGSRRGRLVAVTEPASSASARSASARTCCGWHARSSGEARERWRSSATAAAAGARGPAGDPPRRPGGSRRVAGVDRSRGRRLPAEPRRAVRPRDARGAGVGPAPSSRRASAGRPSSSRRGPGVLVDPLDDDALAPPSTRRRCFRARISRPARRGRARTTSGGRRSGWRLCSLRSCSRSASLISTSGRTASSSPAARAASSACQ